MSYNFLQNPDNFLNAVSLMIDAYMQPQSVMIYNQIEDAYMQPHRKYHDSEHIQEGLDLINKYSKLFTNLPEVYYAWYFHDFVYMPGSKVNEIASADAAEVYAHYLNLSEEQIKIIKGLILNTNTEDEKLLHDIDFSILAKEETRYNRYVEDVSKEYFFKDKSLRANFLIFTLADDKIFLSKHFHKLFEKKARKNLEKELEKYQTTVK